jgi:hypothetical protein
MSFGYVELMSRHIGVIPLCMVKIRDTKDKYNNEVTKFMMCDGREYNIVHHTKNPLAYHQRATLYGGRNKFLRLYWTQPTSDTQMTIFRAGIFEVGWGDGDNGGCFSFPAGYEFSENEKEFAKELSKIPDDDFDSVLLKVIDYTIMNDAWQSKEE